MLMEKLAIEINYFNFDEFMTFSRPHLATIFKSQVDAVLVTVSSHSVYPSPAVASSKLS